MRIVPFAVSAVVTAGLVFALNKQWGKIPPMGKFLSPQHGFWQNAEADGKDFNADLNFPALKGKAEVYFDDRLVPHVFAENDEDLYFITFTCYKWLRLIEQINGYDLVYSWFDYLKKQNHRIEGYVIMPNHVHVMIDFSKTDKSINKIIGERKKIHGIFHYKKAGRKK